VVEEELEAAGDGHDGTQHRLTWVEDEPVMEVESSRVKSASQKPYSSSPGAGSQG
jgi:hypothetical protein